MLLFREQPLGWPRDVFWLHARGVWLKVSSLHRYVDGLQNTNILLLGQALLVRSQASISGGLVLSNRSLTGCAQRQLHNTEMQAELK